MHVWNIKFDVTSKMTLRRDVTSNLTYTLTFDLFKIPALTFDVDVWRNFFWIFNFLSQRHLATRQIAVSYWREIQRKSLVSLGLLVSYIFTVLIMASALDTSWTSRSIFNHYIFDQENLLKFSIPKDFNTVQRRARREELKVLQVEGKCKYCTHKSRVHFGNPSNWERHLRLHPAHHAEYKASVAPK